MPKGSGRVASCVYTSFLKFTKAKCCSGFDPQGFQLAAPAAAITRLGGAGLTLRPQGACAVRPPSSLLPPFPFRPWAAPTGLRCRCGCRATGAGERRGSELRSPPRRRAWAGRGAEGERSGAHGDGFWSRAPWAVVGAQTQKPGLLPLGQAPGLPVCRQQQGGMLPATAPVVLVPSRQGVGAHQAEPSCEALWVKHGFPDQPLMQMFKRCSE